MVVDMGVGMGREGKTPKCSRATESLFFIEKPKEINVFNEKS